MMYYDLCLGLEDLFIAYKVTMVHQHQVFPCFVWDKEKRVVEEYKYTNERHHICTQSTVVQGKL